MKDSNFVRREPLQLGVLILIFTISLALVDTDSLELSKSGRTVQDQAFWDSVISKSMAALLVEDGHEGNKINQASENTTYLDN